MRLIIFNNLFGKYQNTIYICRMELLTITQFAEKHKVSNQAIEYAIDNKKLKYKEIAKKKFIRSDAKYKPNRNLGPK